MKSARTRWRCADAFFSFSFTVLTWDADLVFCFFLEYRIRHLCLRTRTTPKAFLSGGNTLWPTVASTAGNSPTIPKCSS